MTWPTCPTGERLDVWTPGVSVDGYTIIMLGNGSDGVAHEIVTTAVVDDVPGGSMGPFTLEMRGNL